MLCVLAAGAGALACGIDTPKASAPAEVDLGPTFGLEVSIVVSIKKQHRNIFKTKKLTKYLFRFFYESTCFFLYIKLTSLTIGATNINVIQPISIHISNSRFWPQP